MEKEKNIVKGNASIFNLICIIAIIVIIKDFFAFINRGGATNEFTPILMSDIALIVIAYGVLKYTVGKCKIIVTNKRVYGKSVFGSRVDIPLDSISSVSLLQALNCIGVSSSSGTIRFAFITNSYEIHREINKLIINRQKKNDIMVYSSADELKKYKELLDTGAITQEEYDMKKKELLDL